MTDTHIEIAQLQEEIRDYIGGLDEASILFEFNEENGLIKLDMITVNPRHRESFLFHKTKGTDKVDALRKMLDYVENYKERESSYTIQWSVRGEGELHTSYFRAKNILEALDKLYYGRDMNSVNVFSVVMNPIA